MPFKKSDMRNREELHEDYMAHPGIYKQMAKEHNMTLPVLFNRLSPIRKVDDAYEEDAFSDLLYREDLDVNGGYQSASTDVEAWLDQTDKEVGPKEELFWAQLGRDYDECTSLPELDLRRKAASVTTVGQIADNTALNPRQYLALYQRNQLRADIGIADLSASIQTTTARSFGEPQYLTPEDSHRSAVVGEGMPLPVTTLTSGERLGKMKKIGAGLAVSREYEMDQTRMSSIRMWVAQLAIGDEIYMTNEGINMLRGGLTPTSLGGALDIDDILNVQLHFVGNGIYRLDKLFATKTGGRKWIKAHQTVGDPATAGTVFNRPVPDGRFDQIYNSIQVANGVQGPTQLYLTAATSADDPHEGTVLTDTDLLAIDSRFALIFFQLAAGMLSEERYDPRTQVRERFLSRWFGWFLQDPDARTAWTMP